MFDCFKFVIKHICVFLFITSFISCISTNSNTIYIDDNKEILDYSALRTQIDKYRFSGLKYRNYEDVEAINLLIDCSLLSAKNDKECPIPYDVCIEDAYKMLDRLNLNVEECDNKFEYKVYVTRKEKGLDLPVQNATIKVDYISTSTYSWKYMTNSDGVALIKPYYYDIDSEGSVKFSFFIAPLQEGVDVGDDYLEKLKSIYDLSLQKQVQLYFQDNFIEDKTGFYISILDNKNKQISNINYDLQFMSMCSTLKNLKKVNLLSENIESIDDIFDNKELEGCRYTIILESEIDEISILSDNVKMHLAASLYILDNQNKKILHKQENIECISKSKNQESSIKSLITDLYIRVSKILKNTFFKH